MVFQTKYTIELNLTYNNSRGIKIENMYFDDFVYNLLAFEKPRYNDNNIVRINF